MKALTRKIHAELDLYGEERIWDLYAELRSVARVRERLQSEGVAVGNRVFYEWLHVGDRWARWQAVKKGIAQDLADEAYRESQEATVSDVPLRRLRVDTNKWLAEQFDREGFGRGPAVAVQVNVGSAWLEALKEADTPPSADFEVVEADFSEKTEVEDEDIG